MLEIYGYKVTVCELIDPEETPKNVLIRAIKSERVQGAKVKKLSEQYLATCELLSVSPTLLSLLGLPSVEAKPIDLAKKGSKTEEEK